MLGSQLRYTFASKPQLRPRRICSHASQELSVTGAALPSILQGMLIIRQKPMSGLPKHAHFFPLLIPQMFVELLLRALHPSQLGGPQDGNAGSRGACVQARRAARRQGMNNKSALRQLSLYLGLYDTERCRRVFTGPASEGIPAPPSSQ